MKSLNYILLLLLLLSSCQTKEKSYNDVLLLIPENDRIELCSDDGLSRILVSPTHQGRIITSSFDGVEGKSLGWVKPTAFEGGAVTGSSLHGEERVWVGPLGSQFSFYYGEQQPILEDNWNVPQAFNESSFDLLSVDQYSVSMKKDMSLRNNYGTGLSMSLLRKITLLDKAKSCKNLNLINVPKDIKLVAYEINQKLTNLDTVQWKKETGLANLWDLNTFQGTENTVIIIPIRNSSETEVYTYLSEPLPDQLTRTPEAIYYKADGKYRNKIGLSQKLTKGYLASYEPETSTLRIIQFKQKPQDFLYFNSHVSDQVNPYEGESIAVYNHGAMNLSISKDNAFYEMESTSPMKELMPGESLFHYHRLYQFSGNIEFLDAIAQQVLGVSLLPFN